MNLFENRYSLILFSICLSALLTILFLPLSEKVGDKFRILDDPDPRKMHTSPTVRIGGLAMIISYLFTILIVWQLDFFKVLEFNNYGLSILLTILSVNLFSYLIGLIDDIYKTPFWLRLGLQIISSMFIWSQGIGVKFIDLSFLPWSNVDNLLINDFLSLIITILWIGGITNAINWLDGLDGLAAGCSSILSFGVGIYGLINNNILIFVLSFILLGSSLGFLKKNSYPSNIMMGDGGSYFLGNSLAILSIIGFTNLNGSINPITPFILFSVPIFDMIFVIKSRVQNGLSPFYPDKRHLHHRLIRAGFTYKRTVLIIYLINIFFVITSLILTIFVFN